MVDCEAVSYLEASLIDFWHFHHGHGAELSLALVAVDDPSRFGTVLLDEHDQIVEFGEKTPSARSSLINAGAYLLAPGVLSDWDRGVNLSFENEVLPSLLNREIYGYRAGGYFIDIGVPEAYLSVQSRLPIEICCDS